MKKKITTVLSLSVAMLLMSFGIMDDNGRAGSTGSPSENTCNQSGCHNTYQLNSGGGSVKITSSSLTNWSYTPGQTYSITVTVAKTGLKLFGLGFEALTSAGANAGTLTAGTGTVLKSATIGGNSRTSVTHAKNGGTGTDSHAFTFTWKAPATDIGKITFYCAGNAANSSASESGDYIYTTSQVVTSPSTVGIVEQHALAKQITVYPNPTTDYIQITDQGNKLTVMDISILDLKGALIRQVKNVSPTDKLEVADLNTGTYLLKIDAEGKTAFKQFVRQ
ncbi:MAG TPA: choice-of-anchor V domain-containing protein [Bacteroidia bacterium]|jgi:hypothetical protein|nr:choice-of-anchor V domain-containing protein [Bacteroidia bacterium]